MAEANMITMQPLSKKQTFVRSPSPTPQNNFQGTANSRAVWIFFGIVVVIVVLLTLHVPSALPYHLQALLLMTIGVWLWGLNVALLGRAGFSVSEVLEFESIDEASSPVFNIAVVITCIFAVNFFSVNKFADDPKQHHSFAWIHHVSYIGLFCILVMPWKRFYYRQRIAFLRAVGRIVFGSLKENVCFADVILADIFTSISKIFGKMFLEVCCFFTFFHENDDPDIIEATCKTSIIGPILISLPYIWRLRQCLADVFVSNGRNKVQLWNALKYASVFPVIISATLANQNDKAAFQFWILFATINSVYSFIWDIRFDWDLGYFKSRNPFLRDEITLVLASRNHTLKRHNSSENISLQPIIGPPRDDDAGNPYIYYTIIVINFLIRFSWVLPNAMKYYKFQVWPGHLVFLLQLLEIIRRWLWVFIRFEKQALHSSRPSHFLFK